MKKPKACGRRDEQVSIDSFGDAKGGIYNKE